MEKERLLFKFYKSYYDTAKLLDDKNRLSFYDALFEKQFYGIEPKLKGLANLVYVSQKHSIDAQVKGWEDKMKTELTPIEPPCIPPIEPPSIQLKEEVKEKEKEKSYNPDVVFIIDSIKHLFNERYINDSSKDIIEKLLKLYKKDEIIKTVIWAKNDSFWSSNFMSIAKLDKSNKDGVKYIDVFMEKSRTIVSASVQPKHKDMSGQHIIPNGEWKR